MTMTAGLGQWRRVIRMLVSLEFHESFKRKCECEFASKGSDAGLVPLLGHGAGSGSLAKGCWKQKPCGGPGGCLGSNYLNFNWDV